MEKAATKSSETTPEGKGACNCKRKAEHCSSVKLSVMKIKRIYLIITLQVLTITEVHGNESYIFDVMSDKSRCS